MLRRTTTCPTRLSRPASAAALSSSRGRTRARNGGSPSFRLAALRKRAQSPLSGNVSVAASQAQRSPDEQNALPTEDMSGDQCRLSSTWKDVRLAADSLEYPQCNGSYINVKRATHVFVDVLHTVAAFYWKDIAPQDIGVAEGLASPPVAWASLIVQDDTELDATALQTVSDILTGSIPTLSVPDLEHVYFETDPAGGVAMDLVSYCRLLGQQDHQLMAAWGSSPRLSSTEPERLEILQWLTTRHHFPLRTLPEAMDVTMMGPQVVWALVWLHHHVLGALSAWAEGRLTSRQLADIFEVAGRCATAACQSITCQHCRCREGAWTVAGSSLTDCPAAAFRAALALHPNEAVMPPLLGCYALYTAACRLELEMGDGAQLGAWWLLEQTQLGQRGGAGAAATGIPLADPRPTLTAFLQKLGTDPSLQVGARKMHCH